MQILTSSTIHIMTTSLVLFFAFLICSENTAYAQKHYNNIKNSVGVDENLGENISKGLSFRNHLGQKVTIADFLQQDRPVLLTLNYYSCDTLCSAQLNAVLKGLKELDWVPGENFNLVTISIDPDETSSLAAGKRANYLKELSKDNASWDFLVGDENQITTIADELGYRYTYDAINKQYAHPAVIMILSPTGKISRYLYGLNYPSRELKFSLMDAAEGKVGNTVEKIMLSCFSFDNTTGKYTASAFGLMRLAGVITVFCLGVMTTTLWRREFRERHSGSRQ
jgi:protein SCO1